MDAYNLSVCIGQSLLWPASSTEGPLHQAGAAKDVAQLVQFLIEQCPVVFGEEVITLFGELPVFKTRQDSSTDSDSVHSLLSTPDPSGKCIMHYFHLNETIIPYFTRSLGLVFRNPHSKHALVFT